MLHSAGIPAFQPGFLQDFCRFQPPQFQSGDNPAAFHPNLVVRLLSYSYVYALNCWLLVYPRWACFDWAMGCVQLVAPAADLRVAAVAVFWTFVVSLAVRCAASLLNNRLEVCLSVLFILVPFLLCLNIFVTVGFVIAERNLYLSVLGFSLLYHLGLHRLISVLQCPRLLYGLHVLVLSLLAARTVGRSLDWRTETGLYSSGLTVCPGNAKVYYNLAKVLDKDGGRDTAEILYKEAVRLGTYLLDSIFLLL